MILKFEKKTLKSVKLSLFSKHYKFAFYCRKITH